MFTYRKHGEKAALFCPPHPLFGGSRFDVRLERICEELNSKKFSTLSFDYNQPFRYGVGEIEDAKNWIDFLKDRHEFVAIIGYSFGSVVASNVADLCDAAVYISPLPEIDSISFKDSKVPKLFVIATIDQFVSFEESLKLYEKASEPKRLIKLETDHFYFGKFDELAKSVADFLTQI